MTRVAIVTLALALAAAESVPAGFQAKTTSPAAALAGAKEVAERYFRLVLGGAALTAEGRAELAKLLVRTAPADDSKTAQKPSKIDVIEKLAVGNPVTTRTGKTLVKVWFSHLAFLDPVTGRLVADTPGLLAGGDYELRFSEGEWRIVDPDPIAATGVPGAERYVDELLANTRDPSVQRDARRTLAALKKLSARRR